MATYGPEKLDLKNGTEIILRHCTVEDAHAFLPFQKQIAKETVFTLQTTELPPSIDKVRERLPILSDIPKIISYYKENASHLFKTDPTKPKDFYTPGYWANQISKVHIEFETDESTFSARKKGAGPLLSSRKRQRS